MVTNVVHVRVNETYDLSTTPNALGLIAIHTPRVESLRKKFDGLFKNFKFLRFNSVSIRCACASLMPIDPLQVGLEAGQVNPQDMFNPILYKAVSNDAMSAIMDRIYSLSTPLGQALGETSGPSVDWAKDLAPSTGSALDVYYGLLSSDGYRRAMPQAGFEMTNVIPLAHQIVTNVSPTGQAGIIGGAFSHVEGVIDADFPVREYETANAKPLTIHAYGNGTTPLPRFPTAVPINGGNYGYIEPAPVYCAMCIFPPAVLQKLYFRLVVSWSMTFSEFRPSDDIMSLANIGTVGQEFYKSDYATQSETMTAMENSVDGTAVDIELRGTSVT